MANTNATIAELQDEVSHLQQRALAARSPEAGAGSQTRKLPRSWRYRCSPAFRYAMAFLLVGIAWVMTVLLKDSLRAAYFQTPFFFCAIVLSSWFGGFGPGMCSTLLSVFLLGRFFPQPIYNPGFSPNDVPRFVMFLIVGGFISWLGGRQRRDEEALLQAREQLEEKVRLRTLDLQQSNEKLVGEISERIREKVRAEARTESVIRANKTIPASLANVGDTHDVDRLLGEVLTVIVEYLGEEGGGVWIYDTKRQTLSLRVVLEDGKIKLAEDAEHPASDIGEQEWKVESGIGANLLPLFKDNIAAVLHPQEIATLPELAPYRDYLAQRGVRSLLGIPLLAADELVGMISVRSRQDNRLSTDEIAFVQAIALHASLALKMSHLAELERQAVVAEERRDAISRSKEALDRIAGAGRATLQRLARDPGLNTFLDHVLAVSMEQFGAIGTSVWLGDPSTGICSQYIGYRRGDGHSTLNPGYEHHFEFTDESELEPFRVTQGSIVIHREADFARLAPYAERLTGLQQLGIRTLIRIPLFFGAEAKGIFILKFVDERTLSSEEEGLAHTLADQVVLALELTKLSEKAKAAALATERNRMAADVHDTLAQAFAATLLHLRSMDIEHLPPELQSHWRFAQDTAKDGLAAARRTMNAMRTPSPADSRPLPERVAERVRQVAARTRTSTKVRFQLQGDAVALPWTVEDELDRLISEALFNAERHAAAGEITVKLDYLAGSGGLRMRVRDDGRGFDQNEANGAGLGLRSMHDRADRIGASFTLITEAARGTEIVVLWMNETGSHSMSVAPTQN